MRAIVQSEFGGPDVLRVAAVPKPQPLATEVLVRVHAVSVNPVEAIIRSGAFPLLGQPPFILGWDLSGVVEEIVPGTSRFQVGDEVYGMPMFPRAASANAEYIAAPSRQLTLKPKNLDHVQAAALPLAGLTAWQALVEVARLQPNQRLLIHGAGGGVGHIAVQIAKAMGAYVIATASVAKREFVRSLGADEVIDYNSVDFTQAIRDIDVVMDLIGQGYGQRSLQVLRPGGLLISVVERTSTELPRKAAAAGKRFAGIAVEPDYPALERLAALAESGKLRPHVERVLPLEEIPEAHRLIETGATQGKIVLTVV